VAAASLVVRAESICGLGGASLFGVTGPALSFDDKEEGGRTCAGS
jgi:hypothetical protein